MAPSSSQRCSEVIGESVQGSSETSGDDGQQQRVHEALEDDHRHGLRAGEAAATQHHDLVGDLETAEGGGAADEVRLERRGHHGAALDLRLEDARQDEQRPGVGDDDHGDAQQGQQEIEGLDGGALRVVHVGDDVRVDDEDDDDPDAEPAGHAQQQAPQARHEQAARDARALRRDAGDRRQSRRAASSPLARWRPCRPWAAAGAPRPRRAVAHLAGRPLQQLAIALAHHRGRVPRQGQLAALARPSRGGARVTCAAARRARRPPAGRSRRPPPCRSRLRTTASGAPPERPAITGKPVSAASAKTMPKPSTSKPPQRVRTRRGEDVGGAQPVGDGGVDQSAGEVHALADTAPLGAVVEARGQPALADERQMQAAGTRGAAGPGRR